MLNPWFIWCLYALPSSLGGPSRLLDAAPCPPSSSQPPRSGWSTAACVSDIFGAGIYQKIFTVEITSLVTWFVRYCHCGAVVNDEYIHDFLVCVFMCLLLCVLIRFEELECWLCVCVCVAGVCVCVSLLALWLVHSMSVRSGYLRILCTLLSLGRHQVLRTQMLLCKFDFLENVISTRGL